MTSKRTNITVINKELWALAFGRAKQLGYKSVSEYLFDLINKDLNESYWKGFTKEKPKEGG